jgi:hypothetical protein
LIYSNLILDKNPDPTRYSLCSDFTPQKQKQAYTFGISREAYTKVYIKENPRKEAANPGPGHYQAKTHVGVDALMYTMRPKTKNSLTRSTLSPGPAAYQTKPGISPKGQYFVSKFGGSKASVFNPTSSQRFYRVKSDSQINPGPGRYSPRNSMNEKGNYFLSKMSST